MSNELTLFFDDLRLSYENRKMYAEFAEEVDREQLNKIADTNMEILMYLLQKEMLCRTIKKVLENMVEFFVLKGV